MKLVLITGLSGAGKSVALKTLEDCGFEAIDNPPLALLPSIALSGKTGQDLVVGADTRCRDFSVPLFMEAVDELRGNADLHFTIVFLDCEEEVLRRRFTETRRRHPLALDRPVIDGIQHERALLAPLRDAADIVIDTSDTAVSELRQILTSNIARDAQDFSLVLTSFSFRRGLPRDADIVFDVRFLKNPHYDRELQPRTGQDAAVGAYIESDPDFDGFFNHLTQMLTPLLPRYVQEGKHYLTIAIGCTGGKHRSVYMVEKLGAFLHSIGYKVNLRHRDME